ncbi:MAG: FeoB-associated Cys-rich membrane protein [Oscillospiraceae bacterium]|nr:FeoB-associated Cys-rich membrane protein [Oscillospiraceae bacterium]MCI9364486.1 FeoB-associated Cys-rich membrane protein [Oscillospiraceae bacterium]RKJ57292.1 FeoB-associated Cys-rich membrane protein [bacterium 1XD42-8]RKJ65392.1 FeoB-associated Cys-rich membrane protein [bacterium 1XD42-1]
MVTWIVLGIILIAAFFAARYSFRKAKNGECIGCSGCKNGCHCQHKVK